MTEENILDFATTDLIINNAFRLLGLESHASLSDIKRKQKLAALSENLQLQPAINAAASQDALRDAVTSMQDPVERLLHRIFWIWAEDESSPAENNSELIPLDFFQTAITYWEGKISSGQSSIVALHNLAVIYQSVFLESCQRGHHFSSAAEASGEIEKYCEKSLHYWEKVSSSRNFWQKVFEWAATENDPRLSREFLQYLKSQFLPFLIAIFIDSAWEIHITGDEAQSLKIITHLKETSFAQKYQTQAFDYLYQWIEGEARELIKDSKVQVGSQKPAMLYALLHQSVARMQVLLNFAQALAYEDPQKLSRLKDSAAMHFLEPMEDMRRKSEYLFIAMKLMEEITGFPISMHLIKKADDLHRSLVEEHSSGNYWFTEAYFGLRDSFVDSLENARKLFLKQDLTGAVAALEAIKVDQFAEGDAESKAVDQALSVALNAQALRWLDESFEKIKEPRTLIKNLGRGFKNSFGMFCESCGNRLEGKYYTLQVDGRLHQICTNCHDLDGREIRESHGQIGKVFFDIKANLLQAIKLNPLNQAVKKNLDFLYEISNKMDININSETYRTPENLEVKTDWGKVLLVIGIIIAILWCMVGGF